MIFDGKAEAEQIAIELRRAGIRAGVVPATGRSSC
jgi:hypothetical protein